MAQLIILGSGTGIPSLRRGAPCLALLSDDFKVLIDSGPGATRRMLEAGLTVRDIDLLLYTHIHPDHIADLIPFLFACKYVEGPRTKDLWCVGGPGFHRFFCKLETLYAPWITPYPYRIIVKDILEAPLFLQDLTISSETMAHIAGSVGYRIELANGKTVGVSGDTDCCDSLIKLAMDVDLLVLECSFPDEKKVEGHLTPSLAGRIASKSHCKKLILTHLYPICDQSDIIGQCRETFSGELILAEDLMRIPL